MLVSPEERDAYLRFIDLNTSLWNIEDGVLGEISTDRIVIVDLLSHDLHQAIRALYVGKILQRSLRCKLVGLIGNLLFSQDLGFGYDKAEAIRLGRSYGVKEFIDLEDTGPDDISDSALFFTPVATEATLASIRACADDNLPDLVLGWRTPTGCRIGEYIYETIPRITRNPFPSQTRGRLEDVTREAHRIHNIIVEQCRTGRIEAFTAGHLSYTQWGMVADLVLRHGGKDVWFDTTGNFSAYLLTHPPEGNETLSSLVRHIDGEQFALAYGEKERLNSRVFLKLQRLFSSDYFLRPYWWEPTKPPPKSLAPALRKTALTTLGWSGTKLPIVCVFMHCLSDLPRDDEQIYLDYYVWIVETLKIAVRDTSKKWIFKTHPANRGAYDVTNATEQLKTEYQEHKHIVFVDDELEKVEVFAVCDLAVTIRGSIAYEMSIYGKPSLVAGRSVYSELGFCHVANTAEEYAAMLTSDIGKLALTRQMQERANFYLIYDKIAYRIESTFIPYWTYRLTGGNNIWNALCERILYNVTDLDPVGSAIRSMLRGEAPRTVNPRYRELLALSEPGVAPAPHEPNSNKYVIGETLAFSRGGNGAGYLLSKPVVIDPQGSWYGTDQEAFFGLLLDDQSRMSVGAQLAMRMDFFCGPVDSDLNLSIDGRAFRRLPLPGGGLRSELIDLEIDASGKSEPIVVKAWVFAPNLGKIDFRLDSVRIETLEKPASAEQGFGGFVNRLLERIQG